MAYLSVWYWDSLPAIRGWKIISNPRVASVVKILPVLFGPIVYVSSHFLF